MRDRTKKILEEQLELLHERAKTADDEYLAKISAQMVSLAKIIEPELQNQLGGEISVGVPLATLTMRDVADIIAARSERSRRLDDDLKSKGIEIRE